MRTIAATVAAAGVLACATAAVLAQPAGPPKAPAPTPPPPAAAAPRPDEPAAVARLRAMLGPRVTLSYQTAESTDPTRGAVRLSGVVVAEGAKRTTFETLTLDGLRDDGVGDAIGRGMTILDGATTITAAQVHLAGVAVRPPPPGAAFDPTMIAADAIRVERLVVRGDTEVALASAAIEAYGVGRPGRVALAGLSVRLPGAGEVDDVRLGRFLLQGLDLPSTVAALAQRRAPPLTPGRQAIEMDDLSLAGRGRPLGAVGSVRLNAEAAGDGSGTADLAIRAVRVEPVEPMAEWLRRFGYAAVLADLGLQGRYDAPTGRLDLAALTLAARDAGSLTLTTSLDGVSSRRVTGQPPTPADMQRMRLVSFGLRYADQSLLGRVLRDQAGRMGVPEAQLREQYATMAAGALTAPGKAGGLDAVRDAVTRFIRGPATEIEITARPPQPLPLSTFQRPPPGGPAEIQQLLGLTATAR